MVGLKYIEFFIARPPSLVPIFDVHYDLLIAAFGIIFTSYIFAPYDLSGAVVPPLIAVGVGFFLSWISMGLTTEVAGIPFAQQHPAIFAVWIPDVLSVFALFWCVVVARRKGLA